jgi:hypothetical protein
MEKGKGNLVWGVLLVVFGGILLVMTLLQVSIWDVLDEFWPVIFLLGSAAFHVGALTGGKKAVGLVVPGGIFLMLFVIFQLSMSFDWWGSTWPLYILAPALGLFELYLFGERDSDLLIPVGILTGVSVVFLMVFSFHTGPILVKYIVPALIILLGVLILVSGGKKRSNDQ